MSLHDYLALGTRQRLLPAAAARAAAHTCSAATGSGCSEAGLFDLNLVAHAWRPLAKRALRLRRHRRGAGPHRRATRARAGLPEGARRSFCCAATPTRSSTRTSSPGRRCKTLFWREAWPAKRRIIEQAAGAAANFRNTQAVTEIANTPAQDQAGTLRLDRPREQLPGAPAPPASPARCSSWSGQGGSTAATSTRATRASARHAVIVLRDEDKAAARAHFRTPLVFSVHEAKGLEYPARDPVSDCPRPDSAYAEVCEASRRTTSPATNSTTVAPATRATSRWRSTSSMSTRCMWR